MEISGRLLRISPSTHGKWGHGLLEGVRGERIPVVGAVLVGLEPGECYRLTGDFVVHEKYGKQFDAAEALVDAPRETAGLVKFLRTHYKGCGEKTALAIVDWYSTHGGGLEKLRSDLVRRPWDIEKCPGTNGRRIEYMDASGASLDVHVVRRLTAGLPEARITMPVMKRLATWLLKSVGGSDSPVEASWGLLASDPYLPVMHVDGYGLAAAEKVAQAVALPKDHPARLACIGYEAVNETLRKHGHLYLTRDQANRAIRNGGCAGSMEQVVEAARSKGYPLEVHHERVYTHSLRRVEVHVAAHLHQMLRDATPIWVKGREELEQAIADLEEAKGYGFKLDESQREALIGALTSRVRLHSITAGQGSGKTVVLEMIAGLVRQAVFAAPYSKSAKVLNARIAKFGVAATTAHMLLEATGEGFRKNRNNQLVAGVVVLDETGTVDIFLLASLLEAMSPWTHLIVVGDVNQLESVGPGQVLQDIVSIRGADHHRLGRSHRNSGAILDLVGMIEKGEFPDEVPGPEVTFLAAGDGDKFGFEDLVSLWMDCVSRQGFESVGLLFGHRAGDKAVEGWNVTYINGLIQQLINPGSPANSIPGLKLRVADRVIVRKPMTLRRAGPDGEEEIVGQVANGDTGYLIGFSRDKRGELESLRIKLDEGREVDIPGTSAGKVELAYATTVHSAIGSEFAEVVFVIPPGGASGFMNRNLLLTGASRAQKRLWMVGKVADMKAVARRERPPRNSAVAELVNNHVDRDR